MHDTYVDNILSIWVKATREQRDAGKSWYNTAHNLALELSPGDAWRGAGVIASFSPVCSWTRNEKLARDAFRTGVATGHTSFFNACAQSILDGANPLDILKGDKTRAFCAAIATNGESDIATIDRHAHDIAAGRVFSDKERKIGKRIFRDMSAAYQDSAFWCDISTAQMQAVTWVTWRDLKGVKV